MTLRITHYALRITFGRIILLLTLLLAFALRVFLLDFQELRGDEAFGYFFSLRPFADIVQATLRLQEPHPVASYFVQQVWLTWTGHSEFALRFASLWFGVLAVALLYRLGRRLELGRGTPIVAAALLAISPYAVWHSQDARMYSMSLALTIASTWLALEWLQRRNWWWAVAYIGISWLALYTHYFSVFVLLAQTGFALSRALILPRLRFTLISWLSLQIILALLYLPWLSQALETLTRYRGNGDSPTFLNMTLRSLSVFAVGESVPTPQRSFWAVLAAFLLLMAVVRLATTSVSARRALWLLAIYLCLPLLATWYSATQRPIFNERYLIAAAPPFYLLIAISLSSRTIRRPNLQSLNLLISAFSLLSAVILLIGITQSLHRNYTDPAYSKTRGWRDLAAALTRFSTQLPSEQVRLAQNFPDPTLWYYYTGTVEHIVLPPAPQDQNGAVTAVDALAAEGVQRILLPVQPAPNWDDQAIAADALSSRYTLAAEQQIGVWPVQVYVLPPSSLSSLAVEFQNGVTLTGAAMQPQTLVAGDYLVVQLGWRGDAQKVQGTEKVFVQLLNTEGQLVAQDDRPLDLAGLDEAVDKLATYAILLPAELPAGSYRLIAGLYDPSQARVPRVLTMEGHDFVVIAELQGAAPSGTQQQIQKTTD